MHKLKYFILPLVLGIIIASCEKDDTSVIDPILHFPQIDSATVNPNVIDTARINVSFTAYVSSIDPVSLVTAKITGPDGNTLNTINLGGIGNVYYGSYDTLQSCRLVGVYNVEFIAISNAGLQSNTISLNFNVINTQNIKPTVSIIYAPDSLQRPSGIPPDTLRAAFLKVQVTDPNGPCDINGAYFSAFNPSGVPNPFNPFAMYDDGVETPPHCDTVAGDGKFSLLIYIDSNASLGNFTFKFNARDRSGLVSDTLYKFINVHP